ncbi:MAG: TIR domain-containing protein [Planctomycetes bacterium]|nr:TIR domain-containing protein [Planctomycetota bacterium]
MFNMLITADETAWESDQRMGMMASRFGEYSGDEIETISVSNPESLKALERVQSLLMYEDCVGGPSADVVRVGQMRDIRVRSGEVTFRFTESGRIPRDTIREVRRRLQITDWEMNRTHWAVKDGNIPQDVLAAMVPTPQRFDVVLSFAGEDRGYVESVAEFLIEHGVIVFYDKYEQATLWGKDLVEHFESIYRQQARFCVMFISRHYAEKVWARQERRAALARAMAERVEYVLPARFDDTEIPGLAPTIAYLDLRELSPEALGRLILQKLGRR